MFETIKEANKYIGGLSKPSKMPCPSLSIPAESCRIGAVLRKIKGSVCSDCYACKGNYVFPSVKNALKLRLESTKKPYWVDAIVFIINKKGLKYFRFFDSGDIQSVKMLDNICEIARRCPSCKIWLPTRETGILQAYVKPIPANLIIRISAKMIDGPAPERLARKLGFTVSTVSTGAFNCLAPKQGGECRECRKCWDKETFKVSYKKH